MSMHTAWESKLQSERDLCVFTGLGMQFGWVSARVHERLERPLELLCYWIQKCSKLVDKDPQWGDLRCKLPQT